MYCTIDRFEGDFAVVECDDKSFYNIPRNLLPPNVKESDVLEIKIDIEETEKRKKDSENLINEVWK